MLRKVSISGIVLAAAVALGPSAAHATGCAASPISPDQQIYTASSGNVANASAVATLAAPTSPQAWHVTRVEITGGGATSAILVNITLAGLNNGAVPAASATATWTFGAAASTATTLLTPIIYDFSSCPLDGLPGTAVVLTMPALGSGNTNAAVSIHGFVQ